MEQAFQILSWVVQAIIYLGIGVASIIAGAVSLWMLSLFVSMCWRKHKAVVDEIMQEPAKHLLEMERFRVDFRTKTGSELHPYHPEWAAAHERFAYVSEGGVRWNFDVADDFVKDYGDADAPAGADSKAAALKALENFNWRG